MASNFIQPGKVLNLVAPAGGVIAGKGYIIGALFVVALNTAAQGATFEGYSRGVWDLPKAASVTPALGTKAYWNNSTGTVTGTSATGLFPIGVFTEAPLAGDATVNVRLDGVAVTAAP